VTDLDRIIFGVVGCVSSRHFVGSSSAKCNAMNDLQIQIYLQFCAFFTSCAASCLWETSTKGKKRGYGRERSGYSLDSII
jgi:hypothetical protein